MSNFSVGFRTHVAPEREVRVFDLTGELDAHTAAELEAAFQKALADGSYNLLINGTGLVYISSAGLGVFMAYLEDVRERGGDIKIAALQPNVFTVFDLLGFPFLLHIPETEDEALERFALPYEPEA